MYYLELTPKHNQKYTNLHKKIQEYLINNSSFDSKESYDKLIHGLITFISPSIKATKASLHDEEMKLINANKPLSEKVEWGGVTLKKVNVEKDFIQKLLVINRFGILGFEIHKKKLEKLLVKEGVVLFIYSNHDSSDYKKGRVLLRLVTKGDRAVLQPGDEHGMIALTDAIVEESSTNHLDDLVYIYKSSPIK